MGPQLPDWIIDFPHPGCLYGNVRETIQASLGGPSKNIRRRILFGNAAELYKIKAPTSATTRV